MAYISIISQRLAHFISIKSNLVLLLLLLSFNLFAQKGLNLGLKFCHITNQVGGVKMPWARVTDSREFNARFRNNYGHGLVIRYGFSETIGISSGLSHLRHKVRTKVVAPQSWMIAHGAVPMLEIPLLLTFRKVISKNRKLWVNLHTGPSVVFWYPGEDIKSGGQVPGKMVNTHTAVDVFFQQDAMAYGIKSGAGLLYDFDEYGSIYTGFSYNQLLNRSLRFAGEYQTGYTTREVEVYLRGSYFCLDFIYFLNWYAFSGKKKIRESEVVSLMD